MKKFSEMTEAQQKTLITEATNGVVTSATLLNAVRHLRKGRVGHALFFATLWLGYSANAESGRAAQRHREIVAHHECQHRLAGVSPAAKVSPPTFFNHGIN